MRDPMRLVPAVACISWALAAATALPAAATRQGEPPPLLPESVVGALADELSGANARRIVQELSLHHRMRGSQGFRAAAEAIRTRAELYGLEEVEILELPADGKSFYGTQRSRPAWDADFAELWELRQAGDRWMEDRRLASWEARPITLAQDSAAAEVTADLVDVGQGTSPADYEGKQVRGRLVLAAAQPGAVAKLAVAEYGAAGIISYAQNQKSAWWGEDRNLVRWGHLETFPPPETFAFMVTVNQAMSWRQQLGRGQRVRLKARVRAGQHPGVYAIPTAVIPGTDPDLTAQEIVFSCHLDHQQPGANDNASGCAAILEVARALTKLVREGKLAPPRRTLRFIWPPEIEGTIALLNARPDLAARARAVIHMDMVGGGEITKSIFHVTRSPRSLPTVVNDVAEAFGRFVNGQSYAFSASGEADYPLVDPEGSRQALQARFAAVSMGSDHQVWTEGSFRVPAIYLNDWPDRTVHTHADSVANIDPTKLLRAAFIGAASGYYLARLEPRDVPQLLQVVRHQALHRTAQALSRRSRLDAEETANLLAHHFAYERQVVGSVDRFATVPAASRRAAAEFLDGLAELVAGATSTPLADASTAGSVCRRRPEPKGPLWGFGYSYFEDHLARRHLPRPALLDYRGLWGGGSEYAYEVLNLVDGRRSVAAVRKAVAATYGPVPRELVESYLETLEGIGILNCGAEAPTSSWQAAPTGPLAERAPRFPPPESPAELGVAGYAKVLCSALFVSGRDPAEAARNSAYLFLPEGELAGITEAIVDREKKQVRVTWRGSFTRMARFYGDQGCVISPRGADGVSFQPVAVKTTLPDPATQPWPMGDRLPEESLPPELDEVGLEAAVETAFADPEALTAAFLVVYRGQILAERYGPGIDRETQLESWSMGKSLTATLVGVLVQEGALRLEDPAPVPAWHRPGDPRAAIRVIDLLRMSSGLRFIAPRDPGYTSELGYPDHFYIYTGAIDAFEFSISRPLEFPPNTVGRYRNADPLTLGYLVRQIVRRRGEEYLTFPQRALFDRIGIRRQVLETDPYGNFLLTGHDYGTARNWARLGLLYLHDGLWQGERILPEGWARLVSTPAPAWEVPVYGGLFWLNRTRTLQVPEDAFYMAGAGGQFTIIVPSLDLVVVRMGHLRGGRRGTELLNDALGRLVAAIRSRA